MKESATLKQRIALANIYNALHKPFAEKAKIRNMGFGEAFVAIKDALNEIEEKGFDRRNFEYE